MGFKVTKRELQDYAKTDFHVYIRWGGECHTPNGRIRVTWHLFNSKHFGVISGLGGSLRSTESVCV